MYSIKMLGTGNRFTFDLFNTCYNVNKMKGLM